MKYDYENSSKFHKEVRGDIQPCQTYRDWPVYITSIDIHRRKPVIIMKRDRHDGYME